MDREPDGRCRCGGWSEWLTPAEAAAYLRLSRRSLERRMEDTPPGVPKPWKKLGRSVRWRFDEIDAWVCALDRLARQRRRSR